jgi:hypothetical protein
MAVTKIEYANKRSGDIWSSNEANEVKNVVNNNADELSAVKSGVNSLGSQLMNLGQTVTNMQASMQTPKVQQENTTADILPNRLNVWGTVASLTVTLTAGAAGVRNEYMLRFTVGSDSFTLTLPGGIRWVTEPDWENGHTYEVSIEDGLAVAAGWEAAS